LDKRRLSAVVDLFTDISAIESKITKQHGNFLLKNMGRIMITLINFDNAEAAKGVYYGGDAGAKNAMLYNDEIGRAHV
jgi:hypothetical protein